MVKAVCVNGDLDTAKYGSPMPMIGTYIALATLVCFLSISFDIFHGFRRRTPWLPCKLFSLNSFTLTVVSVAAKLPVDLSTPMPRAADQLSKITGSALLCISMGVFMPSLGSMRTSECLANMAALTVLVITVIVNIRIQIVTGVIFTFIPEHIILMVCMLVLLVALWSATLTLYLPKKFCNSDYRQAAEDYPTEWSLESMRKQLMKLYGLSYCCSPQLFCCETMNCIFVGIPSVVCAAIASETVIRSYFVKDITFCKGVSDYKWSVWGVFVIQILCIVMGSFTVLFRWFTIVAHMGVSNFSSLQYSSSGRDFDEDVIFMISKFLLRLHFEFSCKSLRMISYVLGFIVMVLLFVIHKMVEIVGMLVVLSCLKVRNLCALVMMGKCRENAKKQMSFAPNEGLQNKVITLYNDPRMTEWKLRMLANDTQRWIEANKRGAPTHLISLLSKSLTPQQCSYSLFRRIEDKLLRHNDRVSSSTLVFLAILSFLISSPRAEDFMNCLRESMELIFFIEENMNTKDANDILTLEWFQRVWAGMDLFTCWMKRELNHELRAASVPPGEEEESILDHTLRIIQIVRNKSQMLAGRHRQIVCDSIISYIMEASHASIDQLYQCLEVTFLDMLSMLLADLPCAIFKEYHENYAIEERQERVINAMNFFLKAELLGDKVKWSWPTPKVVAQVAAANIDASSQGQGVEGDNKNDGEVQEIGPEDQV